jgi:hypothetical protein
MSRLWSFLKQCFSDLVAYILGTPHEEVPAGRYVCAALLLFLACAAILSLAYFFFSHCKLPRRLREMTEEEPEEAPSEAPSEAPEAQMPREGSQAGTPTAQVPDEAGSEVPTADAQDTLGESQKNE